MTLSCGEGNWNRLRAGSAFDFVEPDSLDDALAALAENPVETALLAGGTDLLRNIRLGNRQPSRVISVARLPELIGIEQRDDGGLTIGALTTMAELAANEKVVEHYPALAEAAAQVGSPQVRNRASMGGNLVNASPCADSAPPAYVFDAVVVLKKSKEQRRLALAEFITGPGQTMLENDEILVAIELQAPGEHVGSAYETLTRRKALEITIASATAHLNLSGPGGTIEKARICLGSVAPTPLLAQGAEKALIGQVANEATIARAAAAAVKDSSPIDDLRAHAQYRRWMVEVLTHRALTRAIERAGGAA